MENFEFHFLRKYCNGFTDSSFCSLGRSNFVINIQNSACECSWALVDNDPFNLFKK